MGKGKGKGDIIMIFSFLARNPRAKKGEQNTPRPEDRPYLGVDGRGRFLWRELPLLSIAEELGREGGGE